MQLPKEFKERMQKMLKAEYAEFEKAFCHGENHSAIRINTLKKDAQAAAKRSLTSVKQCLGALTATMCNRTQSPAITPFIWVDFSTFRSHQQWRRQRPCP